VKENMYPAPYDPALCILRMQQRIALACIFKSDEKKNLRLSVDPVEFVRFFVLAA